MAELTEEESRRMRALQKLHENYQELRKQYLAERQALEAKYQALYEPLFKKRSTIVTGEYEPVEAECAPLVHVPKKADGSGLFRLWRT